MWCENHGEGWAHQGSMILANLAKKAAKGNYSIPLAAKLWEYFAAEGAKSYKAWSEGGSDRKWWVNGSLSMFDAPTRREAARRLEEGYREQVMAEAAEIIQKRGGKRYAVANGGSHAQTAPVPAGYGAKRNPRKYDYLYVLQGHYAYGWEDLATEDKHEAPLTGPQSPRQRIRQTAREYRENAPGAYRIIERKVRK